MAAPGRVPVSRAAASGVRPDIFQNARKRTAAPQMKPGGLLFIVYGDGPFKAAAVLIGVPACSGIRNVDNTGSPALSAAFTGCIFFSVNIMHVRDQDRVRRLYGKIQIGAVRIRVVDNTIFSYIELLPGVCFTAFGGGGRCVRERDAGPGPTEDPVMNRECTLKSGNSGDSYPVAYIKTEHAFLRIIIGNGNKKAAPAAGNRLQGYAALGKIFLEKAGCRCAAYAFIGTAEGSCLAGRAAQVLVHLFTDGFSADQP